MEETMSNFQHDITQLEEAEKVMEDQRSQLTSSASPSSHQQSTPSQQQPQDVNIIPSTINTIFSTMMHQLFSSSADPAQ
eukprot:6179595-Karenia_brevis.AAC.1